MGRLAVFGWSLILTTEDKGLLIARRDNAVAQLPIDLRKAASCRFKTPRFKDRTGPAGAAKTSRGADGDSARGRAGQLQGRPIPGRLHSLADHLAFYVVKVVGIILDNLFQYDLGLVRKNPLRRKGS